MKKLSLKLTVIICICTFILIACSTPITPINVNGDGIAIKGYDPVAYFTQSRPVKGQNEYQFEWNNAKWLFANNEHMTLFQENPGKFAPQYGGYWAYAVSRGSTADIDPEAWAIIDGKLYLNLNKDVQNIWNKDRPGYINKADKNWPRLLGK